MNRAERRRKDKEDGKIKTDVKEKRRGALPIPSYLPGYTIQQICEAVGAKAETLMQYLDDREKEIRDAVTQEAQEKLWRAENYIGVINVMVTLYAINMTWGFKKANQRFLDNYNDAMKLVDKIGVRKAYEWIQETMKINLEFDDMDINKEFGFGDGDSE